MTHRRIKVSSSLSTASSSKPKEGFRIVLRHSYPLHHPRSPDVQLRHCAVKIVDDAALLQSPSFRTSSTEHHLALLPRSSAISKVRRITSQAEHVPQLFPLFSFLKLSCKTVEPLMDNQSHQTQIPPLKRHRFSLLLPLDDLTI